MSIYVSGSMAFDRIMTFPGYFKDHIIQEKLHHINVSFMVDRMEEKHGGCAGNIAYSLALLGEKPVVLSCVGKDFTPYANAMKKWGLPLDGLKWAEELFTALCYITTDLSNNQITGFYPGAMSLPCNYTFPQLNVTQDIAIVSPGNCDDMRTLPAYFKEKNLRYIYDPGQQLPVLPAQEILTAIDGSFALTCNDYELDMICKTTEKTPTDIEAMTEWCIITCGEKGAEVIHKGVRTHIAIVPPTQLVDPTGAGDAHRAGLLKGLTVGMDVIEAAQVGSTCASFAIEQYGTQLHSFTHENFIQRYKATFGEPSKALW